MQQEMVRRMFESLSMACKISADAMVFTNFQNCVYQNNLKQF